MRYTVIPVVKKKNDENHVPIGDGAKVFSSLIAPPRVRTTARTASRKLAAKKTTFHLRRSCRRVRAKMEWRDAVTVSHGKIDQFFTAFNAQLAPLVGFRYPERIPSTMAIVRKTHDTTVHRRATSNQFASSR